MAREKFASKVTFFPKTENGFGEAVKLKWCEKLTTKDSYKTSEQKGDGTIESSTSMVEKTEIGLEISSSIPLAELCKITGERYIKGMAVTNTATKPIIGCLAYEIDMDGEVRRRAILNATLNKNEHNNETDSEGEVYKFEGVGIGDENGDVYLTIDEKEVKSGADAAVKKIFDDFFTTCPTVPTESASALNVNK